MARNGRGVCELHVHRCPKRAFFVERDPLFAASNTRNSFDSLTAKDGHVVKKHSTETVRQ